MADQLPSIRKEVTELKESKNWHSNIQNETNLFKHMLNTKYENDLVLKNPDDPIESAGLTQADKKFMRFFLKKINERRYANISSAELEDMRISGDKRYYELPLAKASSSSEVAARGMMGFLKENQDYQLIQLNQLKKLELIWKEFLILKMQKIQKKGQIYLK